MGTHPIFESDFDCLTESVLRFRKKFVEKRRFFAKMSATVKAEGFTVVRVKRKKEDDPDKGLKVDLKRRKIDVKFSYAGTVASKDAEHAIALVTPTRKRKNPVSLDEISDFKEKLKDEDTARFYDILYEEIENRKQVDISLNGAKLIRENLLFSDSQLKSSESEYVYDIYYTNDIIQKTDDMIFESYDSEFIQHFREEEADWKNDSDSNDEENWRNDYPDEESSDEEARSYDSLTRSNYSDFEDEINEENDYYDPTEND